MLAFMQLVFRYLFLEQSYVDLALSDFNYILLVIATVCVAAGGYVINNIMDQETDEIAKPQNRVVGVSISETVAYNWYIGLTIVGVGIGFYLSNVIYKPTFASMFILVATLLYMYATSFKQIPVLGNVVVALLLSTSIIIIGLFDILPAIDADNRFRMKEAFSILMDYAIFAFIINLNCERFRGYGWRLSIWNQHLAYYYWNSKNKNNRWNINCNFDWNISVLHKQ
jgi:4-hydroxybenzoate polyprenyltransferase